MDEVNLTQSMTKEQIKKIKDLTDPIFVQEIEPENEAS